MQVFHLKGTETGAGRSTSDKKKERERGKEKDSSEAESVIHAQPLKAMLLSQKAAEEKHAYVFIQIS